MKFVHTFYATEIVYRYSVTCSWLNLTEIFLSTLSRSMILVNKSRTSGNVTHESLRHVPWACKLHRNCFFLSYSLSFFFFYFPVVPFFLLGPSWYVSEILLSTRRWYFIASAFWILLDDEAGKRYLYIFIFLQYMSWSF